MRSSLLLLLLAAGCARHAVSAADPTLPEAAEAVAEQAPDAILAEAANSMDPSQRARALAWLIRTTDDVPAWGRRAAWDPSPWVQQAAIAALATRGDAGAAVLTELADRDAAPSARALAALVLPVGAVDLGPAWRAASDPWDRAPLALAAMVHGDRDAEAALGDALSTGEIDVDLAWIDALARHGTPALREPLAAAQDRVDPSMATAIAAARLQLGDPRAEAPLRQALGGPTEVRLEALDRLATVDHPAADDLLARARGAGPDVVRAYAELLDVARSGERPERLRRALDAPDREVRALAVAASRQALARGPASRSAAREARRTLVDALADPDLQVRAEAARAVGELGVTEAASGLTALLTDEVPWVRVEAAGALLALRR